MAQTTKGVHLIQGTTAGTMARIGTDPNYICIKDFPDMDNADPDQVEITTLCDGAHNYIDGLENLPDELTFTMNYSATDWATLEALLKDSGGLIESYWGIQIGESGKKWYCKATGRLVLVGGGVGDALEMRIVLKPKSPIENA